MKSGMKTTEFWMILGAALIEMLATSGYAPALPKEALYAVMTYAAGRSVAKAFGPR